MPDTNSLPEDGLAAAQSPADCYLDLLKRILTREIVSTGIERRVIQPHDGPKSRFACYLNDHLRPRNLELIRLVRSTPDDFRYGSGKTDDAETLLGLLQLENMQRCISDVLRRNVPGDFIEAGVWRGGMSIFMRGALKAHRITDRKVYLADSFAGLPESDPRTETFVWQKGVYAASLENVRRNFARYGLLDDQVVFLKGYFSEVLPGAPIGQVAILRIDADLYQSTMDALQSLYPALSPGGYAIFDDYQNLADCQRAIDEYRGKHAITEKIHSIDRRAVFWQKSLPA